MNRERKKILHFIDSAGIYGAENVILNLSREMISRKKYEPVIGCIIPKLALSNDLYNQSLRLGLSAEKIQIRNTLVLVDIVRAARKLKTMGVDLIHCHGYKAYVFAFLIGKLIRTPVISTCHLWFLKGSPPLKMRFMIKCEIFLYKFARIIITVSEPIKSRLLASGIDGSKIKVINNGIHLSDYQQNDKNSIQRLEIELNLLDNPFVVMNIGRLSLQKAQKTIIEAAAQINDTKKQIRFLIVGHGELHSELERYITEKRVGHMVRLLGFREDIRLLLSVADLFILPSLDEGMPMSLLEAVACRVPVIATMVGDIPKIIQHEVSGIAVPVNDAEALAKAILDLESSPEKRARLAAEAFQKLSIVYSSSYMYKQYQDVYRQALKTSQVNRL